MVKRHRNTPPKLRFRSDKRLPFHRLPFVGGRSERGLGICCWNVPERGGYIGGCSTGGALAVLYLQFLRAHGEPEGPSHLQKMVLDMAAVAPLSDARKGQVVGFFTTLEPLLIACCRSEAGRTLNTMSRKALLREANLGLAFDEMAWIAEREKAEGRSGSQPVTDQP